MANSGCTTKEDPYTPPGAAAPMTLLSAYKFFENDPVLFRNGLKVCVCVQLFTICRSLFPHSSAFSCCSPNIDQNIAFF